MSEEIEAVDITCCASCGVAEIDDIKLTECDGCDLVRYCSDECQQEHKSVHDEACKKRGAELRDEILFKQPESTHYGDCPICSLPLPVDPRKSSICHSCSKVVCNGCDHANIMREMERRLQHTCPFCRESLPETDEEDERRRMKRIEANDPVAMVQEGTEQYQKGEYECAFGYWTKAAELGDAEAHYKLAEMYHHRHGIENEKGKYHWEEAAIGGHPGARYMLGCVEWKNGNYDGAMNYRNAERAVRHWIISATQGYDSAIKMLMKAFKVACACKQGFLTKDDLAATLRAHKAAVDATKSPQREEAELATR